MHCARKSRFGNRRSSRRAVEGAPRRGIGGVREGAWVGRAPAGSGSGRHVEEGTWCCSNDDACRSAAPPIAPLPSRRVAASRGQCRWCGGGGSLHRPAAGAAITSMRGGCRRLVWLEAYADRPSPTADPAPGVWGEPRSSSLMVYGGGGGGSPFPPAAIPIPPRSREVARPPRHGRGCAYTLRPFSSTAIRACCAPAWCVSSSCNPR